MKKKRQASLKASILLYTVVPVAISFVVICLVMFAFFFNSYQESAKKESLLKGREYVALVEGKMVEAVNYLTIATGMLETQVSQGSADRELTQKAFLEIFERYQDLDGTSVMFEENCYDGLDAQYKGTLYGTEKSGKICWYFYADGDTMAYLPEALEDEIEFTLPHYTDAKETGKPIYTDPTIFEVDGEHIAMFTITYPMKDQKGNHMGAVTVDLFLEDLYLLLQEEKIYDTGYMVITNDKNQVVYSPDFEDIGRTREETGRSYPLPDRDQDVLYSNTIAPVTGKSCLVTTVPLYVPAIDCTFYVSVVAPTEEIFRPGIRLMILMTLISIAIILTIAVVIYYFIDKTTRPIREITQSATHIVGGTIDQEILFRKLDENEAGLDEVHTLAISIKKMLAQINEAQKAKLETLEMRHKKERAEAEARSKSDFLAKMSHEIRTPMNAIMGMSELILRKELPSDAYDNALSIKSASSNLLSIINDILDFSKIESGKLEIVENDYSLASLVNDVISIIRMRIMENPLLFVVNVDAGIPATLNGDEVRLRQIMLNLLSNAVKYTREGSISLDITGKTEKGKTILSIVISDTGIGIKEDDLNRLFGDFVQIDLAANKGIEGTGLGLAISRNLCRAMGGDVRVTSEYGKGSTFTVTLPQKSQTEQPFAVVDKPERKSVLLYESREIYVDSIARSLENLGVPCKIAPTVSTLYEELALYPYVFISAFLYDSIKPILRRLENEPVLVLLTDSTITLTPKDAKLLSMPVHSLSIANVLNNVHDDHDVIEDKVSFTARNARVLIVDDIEANLKVGEGLLASYEMQVDLCRSGLEAIDSITKNHYDLVFMDHMMPDMDGIQATEAIRAMPGEYYQKLPIVALTANAISGIREMFIQSGMSDFLSKPIETVKLDAILHRWIPKSKRDAVTQTAKHPELSQKTQDFVEKAGNIPGIDADRAMGVLGDSMEAYERVLRLTIRLLPENADNLNRLIETDLPLYAIAVHGVKGVLNNIGAYALGDRAQELESLSKAGDWDACREGHPAFLQELESLTNRLLPLMDDDDTEKPAGDSQDLLKALPELTEAMENFDSEQLDRLLTPLQAKTYGPELDQWLKDCALAVEQFDFDKMGGILEQMKGWLTADA